MRREPHSHGGQAGNLQQSARMCTCMNVCFYRRRWGSGSVPDVVLSGYCIEKSHACVRKWQEKKSSSRLDPTCDVHVHDASAGTDAVGGVADICPSQVVGHRALEEQGVVFDFHVRDRCERAVQAVKTENKNRQKKKKKTVSSPRT